MTRSRKLFPLFVATIALLTSQLVASSAASAASLYKQNQSWTFDDTAGASNTVTVNVDTASGVLVVTSVEAFQFPDSSCTLTTGSPNSISCPLGSGLFLHVNLGDGNDVGSSLMASPSGVPLVEWKPGQGDDRINGGGNHDIFLSPEIDGADTFIGGGGTDTVNYRPDFAATQNRQAAVALHLDGLAGSGAAGEGDTFGADIEGVFGTDFGDTVIGNALGNELTGDGWLITGDGDDTLEGAGGDDALRGNKGNDKLNGGPGNDLIYGDDDHDTGRGGAGNDVLHGVTGNDKLFGDAGVDKLNGGTGNDSLVGGPGKDTLNGDAGNDNINAKDGKRGDKISCGAGRDTVTADPGDKISRDCERKKVR